MQQWGGLREAGKGTRLRVLQPVISAVHGRPIGQKKEIHVETGGTKKLNPAERVISHLAVKCSHTRALGRDLRMRAGSPASTCRAFCAGRGDLGKGGPSPAGRGLAGWQPPWALWWASFREPPARGFAGSASWVVGLWACGSKGPSRGLFAHLLVVSALQAHPMPCHTGVGALGKSVSPSQSLAWGISSAACGCVLSDAERRARVSLAACEAATHEEADADAVAPRPGLTAWAAVPVGSTRFPGAHEEGGQSPQTPASLSGLRNQ